MHPESTIFGWIYQLYWAIGDSSSKLQYLIDTDLKKIRSELFEIQTKRIIIPHSNFPSYKKNHFDKFITIDTPAPVTYGSSSLGLTSAGYYSPKVAVSAPIVAKYTAPAYNVPAVTKYSSLPAYSSAYSSGSAAYSVSPSVVTKYAAPAIATTHGAAYGYGSYGSSYGLSNVYTAPAVTKVVSPAVATCKYNIEKSSSFFRRDL